jgi:hypothetical protein
MGFQEANKLPNIPTELTVEIIQVGQREVEKSFSFSSVTKVSCKKIISGFEVLRSLRSEGSFRGPTTPLIFREKRIMIYPLQGISCL